MEDAIEEGRSPKRRRTQSSPVINEATLPNEHRAQLELQTPFSTHIPETPSLPEEGLKHSETKHAELEPTSLNGAVAHEHVTHAEDGVSAMNGGAYEGQQLGTSKRKRETQASAAVEESQGESGSAPADNDITDGSNPSNQRLDSGVGHSEAELDAALMNDQPSISHAEDDSQNIETDDWIKASTTAELKIIGDESRPSVQLPGLGLLQSVATGQTNDASKTKQLNGQNEDSILPTASESIHNAGLIDEKAGPDPVFASEALMGSDNAEWRLDSSDVASTTSSDDASSDTDTSSDSEDVDDYELLNPEEQARILMQGDGGSDDEGAAKGGKAAGSQLRTKNEKADEKVEKPNIVVTPKMGIEELGTVESMVDNLVVIRARTSGEYKVLETGSCLCLENRSVIGVVAETLGRVHQPLYSVRFTNAAEIAKSAIEKGTKIFYVEQHSTFVFTEALKAIKGSDASNIHDEEVADDEMEFSDDEAEADYRKRKKQEHQAKKESRTGVTKAPAQARNKNNPRQERSNHYTNQEINYDDVDEELYTPLARPSNFHEIQHQGNGPFKTGVMAGNQTGRQKGHDFRKGHHERTDYFGRGAVHQNQQSRESGVTNTRGISDDIGKWMNENPYLRRASPPTGQIQGQYPQEPRHYELPQGLAFSEPPRPVVPDYSQEQQYPPRNSENLSQYPNWGPPQAFNPAEPYSHFFARDQFRPDPLPPPVPSSPLPHPSTLPPGAWVNPAFWSTQQNRAPILPPRSQAPPIPGQYQYQAETPGEPPLANWGPGPPFRGPPPQTPWSSQQHSPTFPGQQVGLARDAGPAFQGSRPNASYGLQQPPPMYHFQQGPGSNDDNAISGTPPPKHLNRRTAFRNGLYDPPKAIQHGQYTPPQQRSYRSSASSPPTGHNSASGEGLFADIKTIEEIQRQLAIIKGTSASAPVTPRRGDAGRSAASRTPSISDLNGGAKPFEPSPQ